MGGEATPNRCCVIAPRKTHGCIQPTSSCRNPFDGREWFIQEDRRRGEGEGAGEDEGEAHRSILRSFRTVGGCGNCGVAGFWCLHGNARWEGGRGRKEALSFRCIEAFFSNNLKYEYEKAWMTQLRNISRNCFFYIQFLFQTPTPKATSIF